MSEPKTPSHFAMPYSLLNALVSYLQDQPWKEVSPLIEEIKNLKPVTLIEEKKSDEPNPTSS